jgi:hypothetical protein
LFHDYQSYHSCSESQCFLCNRLPPVPRASKAKKLSRALW